MFILNHNIFATIYFNFKMLPWKQAIHLPVDIGGKIKFIRLNGSIEIIGPITSSMIKIGFHGSDMFPNETTVIDICGKIIINGSNIRIGRGCLLRIEKKGICYFGNNTLIGARSIILCEKRIDFGANLISAWNCQFMDTDTHSIKDMISGIIKQRFAPIVIGNRCWIGNHVIINKGTVLPNDTIIASSSLCNRDYSETIEPFSILGGIPAKLLTTGKRRMDDKL